MSRKTDCRKAEKLYEPGSETQPRCRWCGRACYHTTTGKLRHVRGQARAWPDPEPGGPRGAARRRGESR